MAIKDKETIFDEIIERLCNGELISKILSKDERPKNYPTFSTFFEWLEKEETKAERYARARAIGIEKEVDEIRQIADEPLFYEEEEWTTDEKGVRKLVKVVKKMNHQQKAQMIDARKWRAGKMSGKYANKATVDLNQNKKINIVLDLGTDEDEDDEDE